MNHGLESGKVHLDGLKRYFSLSALRATNSVLIGSTAAPSADRQRSVLTLDREVKNLQNSILLGRRAFPLCPEILTDAGACTSRSLCSKPKIVPSLSVICMGK